MTNKLFPPLTYSIQNGEPIIEGYTTELPLKENENGGILPTTIEEQEKMYKWQQSKVAVKVDKGSVKEFRRHAYLTYSETMEVDSFSEIDKTIANKGINIDFLADRIYLHEVGIDSVFTTTAFILPEKKEVECDGKCAPNECLCEWEDMSEEQIKPEALPSLQAKYKGTLEKLYSIEQIEKATNDELISAEQTIKDMIENGRTIKDAIDAAFIGFSNNLINNLKK